MRAEPLTPVDPKRIVTTATASTTFTEFMKNAAKTPTKADIVEIGDNQFQLKTEAHKEPESKEKQQESTETSDKSGYPNLTQFIIQPIQIKTEMPLKAMLQSFIQETVQVIQTLNAMTGKKEYQFTFTEPPLKVNFEAQEKKVHIKVTGDTALLTTLEDLKSAQKELRLTLQKIFPDIEVQLAFQETPPQFSQSNSGNKQQQHRQRQSEDEQEDPLA